ncbi:MAG: acyl-CoA/acyl-ACP dehydrogenase [Gemmataceae bacterium]|nr:acyl-CoA/acyl-ACP dehydrogenase [Gemmataceae bacterium]MDW8265614.1 acyl-CoA dehydrogenase family protein [Gemmataceae bacterium]
MAFTSATSDIAWSLLARQAQAADEEVRWPAPSWELVGQLGGFGWAIPREFGGSDLELPALLAAYQHLAAACLTSAFLLSQRDAAIRRIRAHASPELQRELLRPLACGGRFATVGISQLTTSRQHQGPALTADLATTHIVLDGLMPWVSGAPEADHFVTGGVLPDGRQVLVVLPRETPGVSVGPPMELMALQGSLTAEVRCQQAVVDRRWLLAGPAEHVLRGAPGGTGGLETSALALGLAQAALDYLRHETAARPELATITHRLTRRCEELGRELLRLAANRTPAEEASALRARANTLVLRATQTALTVAKGAGFLRQHPAQRWARQALFFLVWSCPRSTVDATLAALLDDSVSS